MRIECFDAALNASVPERLDPLLGGLMQLLVPDEPWGILFVIVQLSVAAAGVLVLLRSLECSWASSLLGVWLFCMMLWFAAPLSSASTMACWFPWLLVIATLMLKSDSPSLFLLMVFTAVLALWLYSGGARAFFGILLVMAWIALTETASSNSTKVSSLMVLLVALLLSVLLVPDLSQFDYPTDARLVPLSPLFFQRSVTYFGTAHGLSTVYYPEYMRVLQYLLYSVFPLLLGWIVLRFETRIFLGVAAVICLCAEYFLPGEWRLLGGFELMKRLVPGVTILPSPVYLFLPIASVLVAVLLRKRQSSVDWRVAIIALGSLGFGLSTGRQELFASQVSCFADRKSIDERISRGPSNFISSHKRYLWPSAQLAELVELQKRHHVRKSVSIVAESVINQASLGLAVDGDIKTAWTSIVPQQPGMLIRLKLNQTAKVNRVVLRLGKFTGDFPRGLQVRGISKRGEHLLVDEPRWYGPIEFTASGLPYFGPEQRVALDFSEELELDELQLVLSASDPTFAWSIAEVEIYGTPD